MIKLLKPSVVLKKNQNQDYLFFVRGNAFSLPKFLQGC